MYWVTDLSVQAQAELYLHCKTILINDGHEYENVINYLVDLQNEKLSNLSELVSNDYLSYLKSI